MDWIRIARRAAVWLFWPALALVVWGELTPHPPHLEAEASDKFLHFIAYFGLAGIATTALGRRRALAVVAGLIALGGLLEILQSFTGRDAEWLDEAANSLGAILGAAGGLLFLALVRQTPRA
ncbi:MAG TPA: VanZ family protein [Rhizomicrobium sp.]|nr:VanZ family protein [Rhizomicrobium sp.]